MHTDRHDDALLIERAKHDSAAFAAIFDKYYSAIFNYTIRRVQNWSDAADITAEVFFNAFKALPRFTWRGIPLSAWLYRIATREIGMYFRRGKRAPASLNALLCESGFEPIDPATLDAAKREAEDRLEADAEFNRLRAAIIELPLKYQDVISLRYFERKSVREISEILHRPEGTVKSLISRGIDRLRDILDQNATFDGEAHSDWR